MDAALAALAFGGGHNSAVVVAGAALLGAGAGVAGVFPLLRGRALVSDAVSHATLPGVALGFLAGAALGGTGPGAAPLTLGAAATGALGLAAVQWIRDRTRLPEDSAIGSVLGVMFGAGVVLLSHIQAGGGAAGLSTFLLGSTAAMGAAEAWLAGGAALAAAAVVGALLKELRVVAFDETFAAAGGWSAARLDLAMLGVLLVVVVAGIRMVGVVLVIALVIIPPAAARLWTARLVPMVGLAALFGAVAGWAGAAASAGLPGVPTGPVIVVAAGAIFAASMAAAPVRAALARARAGRRAPP